MDILQLRYFYESAKHESFTKTAMLFQVPTTSVSASVKRLETELNCTLFDRTSNRIVLNADGRHFYESMRVVFTELDNAVGALSTKAADTRPVRLLVRAMRRKITDKIVLYRALYPNVSFCTSFDFRDAAYDKYDIIIDERSGRYENFECHLLYDYALRFKCAANDPLFGKEITLAQLSDREFVSMGEDSNLHRILLEACRKAGFTPKISVLCNDIECYDKLVVSGMGIALGRERAEPEPGICYLNITDFHDRYRVCAYSLRESCYGNVKAFLNFIQE